jgi:uncharacterized protein YecE (DUF72 family)
MTTRDTEIRRAVEARAVQDVRILQKVNHAHREAFREKFPGQIEHAMRLTAERLQALLTKTETTVLNTPSTWNCSAQDIRDLAVALDSLHNIHIELNHDRPSSSNTTST